MPSPFRFGALGFVAPLMLAASALVSPALAEPCQEPQRIPLGYFIRPQSPCPGDSVFLTVSTCRPCVELLAFETSPRFTIRARVNARACLLREICLPETRTVALGRFVAGNYRLKIDVEAEVVNVDSTVCTVARADSFAFDVARCTPGAIPFVDDIIVGQRVVCITTPCPDMACPNDSIPVRVTGTFPDDCHVLRRIEFVRSITPVVGPPVLRILFDDLGCLGRPCIDQPVPWSALVFMHPLPPGPYQLPIEAAVVTCSDSFPHDSTVHRTTHDFVVLPSCPEERRCFRVAWPDTDHFGDCNLVIAPGQPGLVKLGVAPTVAMAGLQGDLVFDRPGLRITNLVPIHQAQGMRLQWRTTERGARFVLFAERGAPIPPYLFRNAGGSWPVLAVTIATEGGATVADRTLLDLENASGSDSTGGLVGRCAASGFPETAVICGGSRCDMNGDGAADVRDLVLMAHCVLGQQPCPAVARDLDCNRDGRTDLDDVLCCARFVLGGGSNDSTGVRPEPGIRVDFDETRTVAGGIEVPLTLHGADRVGGARLAIAYPAERFDVRNVTVSDGSEWLNLHEVRDGKIVIGLISMANPNRDLGAISITLDLALKPGQTMGGMVRMVESDFSGPDGVGLVVDLGQPGRGLGPGTQLRLSASRPNPFSATTRFGVELGASSQLEVAVYDLSGRSVTSLFRGHSAPGTRELEWNGRNADGRLASSGVYFIRASAGGEVVSRKVVLLNVR